MTTELTLLAGNRAVSGWTAIRVARGIEDVPSRFDISMTEISPDNFDEVLVNPGDPCEVKLGPDLVLTGYVDRVIPQISAKDHSVRLIGRGKCEDLVDCAAVWDGGQISGTSALDVARKLAATYGISVRSDVQGVPPIPQFNLMLGETPYTIIERISRYSALLAYEETDGNLLLTRVGAEIAGGGIAEGVNIQSASVEFSMDQRFSEYVAFMQGVDVLGDIGEGGNQVFTVTDPNVPRRRRRVIIAETVAGPLDWKDFLLDRAVWESARRAGRSKVIRVEVDSWRDDSGVLWTPNTLVAVSIPTLKIPPGTFFTLGSVEYQFDDRGTRAELVLMPPGAFSPEPQQPIGAPFDVPPNPGR